MPFRRRSQPAPPPPTQDAQKNLEHASAEEIYQQVASNARQELGRSTVSLVISGFAGGTFMGLSALVTAIALAMLTPTGSAPSGSVQFIAEMFYPLRACSR